MKVYKKTYSAPIPADAVFCKVEVKRRNRKETVEGVRFRGSDGKMTTAPLTAKGDKVLLPTPTYYGWVNGKDVPLCESKAAAETMLADLRKQADRVKAGLVTPQDVAAEKPIAEHIADYAAVLRGKGDSDAHVRETMSRISKIAEATQAKSIRDIDHAKVSRTLNAMRQNGKGPELPTGKEEFTPHETQELLGISRSAVALHLRRHNLPATGNGKARRYPRSTVETLVKITTKGVGPETTNHYIRALRGFTRWLVKVRRLDRNPLEALELVNSEVEIRHARRELTAVELAKLFNGTKASNRMFRRLTGVDRHALYAFAAGTGLRAEACAKMTPEAFAFAEDGAVVTLAAKANKSKKKRTIPLPADVAKILEDYMRDKPRSERLWPGLWFRDASEMMLADLADVGIAYIVRGEDGTPLHADFHALRHSYLTLLGRSGVDLRTAQELADHSTPVLTARYSHRSLDDLKKAVNKLPELTK